MNLDEIKRRLESAGLDPSVVNGPGQELDLYAHNVVRRRGYYTSYVTDGRDNFVREFTFRGRKVKFATEEAAYDYLLAKLTAPAPKASTRPGKSPEALDEQRAYSRAQTDAALAKRAATIGARFRNLWSSSAFERKTLSGPGEMVSVPTREEGQPAMNTLTTARLILKLKQLGFENGPFSINDRVDDSLCLLPLSNGEWETFVEERGQKSSRIVWPDEETACFGFLGQIAWSRWAPQGD